MKADQLVNLANSGVEIHGFDGSKLGGGLPRSLLPWSEVDKTLCFVKVSAEEAGEKTVAGR